MADLIHKASPETPVVLDRKSDYAFFLRKKLDPHSHYCMNKEIPANIREFIGTDSRQKIFEVVANQTEPFTISYIYNRLRRDNVNINRTTVQNFLTALCFRKFLKVVTEDDAADHRGRKRGRPSIVYKIQD